MKNKFLKSLVASIALAVSGIANAGIIYDPFGVQSNIDISTVTGGGWTLCYQETMSVTIGNFAENVLDVCDGDYLMMAGRATGSNNLLSLAHGLLDEVTFDTGQTSTTHVVNGANWWFSNNWSWGFTVLSDTVSNNQCDVSSSPNSMCLHTLSFTGGYRINDITGLNSSSSYEKLFFVANRTTDVPEPTTLAILALGLIGLASRKFKG